MLHIGNTKKRALRILCLCLALATCFGCFVACDNGDSDDTQNTGSAATSTEESTEVETLDDATATYNTISDADVNWGGGDFTILCSKYNGDNLQELISYGQSGDALPNAVFERNTRFEDKCNLNLAYVEAKDKDDTYTKAQKEVQGNTGDFQYFTIDHATTASLAVEGNLYNFLDMDIDLEKEWWDQGTYSFNLEDHVFFMNGSWNFSDDRLTWCMLFNKKAYELQQYEDPYQLVLDGKWTLAKFNELIQGFSHDSNGDGDYNEEDTYGFVATPHYSNALFFGAGLRYVNMNKGDYPTLALSEDSGMMDRASALVDDVITLYKANNATYRPAKFETAYDMFKNNQALFYGECVAYVINLNKEYEGSFGVLPVPKYGDEQTEHYTFTQAFSSTLAVPTTIKKTEMIGDITQVFSILSHQLVFPAFYDVVLTTKSVKDPQSVEMLNIIFRNRVYDLSTYFEKLEIAGLFAKSAESGNNNFSRDHKSVARSFNKNVRELFKKLT